MLHWLCSYSCSHGVFRTQDVGPYLFWRADSLVNMAPYQYLARASMNTRSVSVPARIRTRPVSVPGTYRYTARTRARPGLPASRFGRASRHPATAGLLPGKPEGRQRERALKIRREGAENPPALTGFPPGRIRNLNLKSTGNGKESTGPGRPGGRTRVARRPADELGSLSQSRRGRQLRNTNISDRCGWGRTDRHLACSRNQ